MTTKITKEEMNQLCSFICREIGESFEGPFSLEMDVLNGSMTLSFRGSKQWYKVRDTSNGLDVLDNDGNYLNSIPGLHLPKCEKMEEFEIKSQFPSCNEIIADLPDVQSSSNNTNKTVIPPFSLKIFPEMPQKEVLELIKSFLYQSHRVVSSLHNKDGVYWLTIDIPSEQMPSMRLIVTTQISGKGDITGSNIERVLLLRLFSRVYVPPDQRALVLEKINAYHNRAWAGTFRIHPDNEIEGSWSQNILKDGIYVEYFWDAIIRLLSGWKSLYLDLKK